MALPLILGVGAGILGGAQYLLKQQDNKQAQSLLGDFQNMPQIPGMAGPQLQQMYMGEAGRIMEQGGFLSEPNKASQLAGLRDSYMRDYMTALGQQQALQAAADERSRNMNESRLTSVWEQREVNDTTYGKVQDQARVINSLYNQGNLSAANLTGMVNAIARMQFPNEALNEADIARVMSGVGWYSNFMNKIRKLDGKADPDLAKAIYDFGADLYKGNKASWEAGERNIDKYIAQERDMGYLPTGRAGRRFGTVDPAYEYYEQGNPAFIPYRNRQNAPTPNFRTGHLEGTTFDEKVQALTPPP